MYFGCTFLLMYIACTSFVHWRYIIMYIVKLTMYMDLQDISYIPMYISCTSLLMYMRST